MQTQLRSCLQGLAYLVVELHAAAKAVAKASSPQTEVSRGALSVCCDGLSSMSARGQRNLFAADLSRGQELLQAVDDCFV